MFMRIPAVRRQSQRRSFFQDMKGGLLFVKRFKGLRYSVLIFGVLNFFANTGSFFWDYLLASTIKIPTFKRFRVFCLRALMTIACMALFPVRLNMI